MKKVLLVLPLAIMLANCNTPRRTTGTGRTGTSDSATSNSVNAGTSGSMSNNNASGMSSSPGMYGNVYDPNNYMQNPEKYKRPVDLIKTGGWTYLTDWRVNTNFTPEAVGQWQLVPTPEVAANWVRDTSRPQTFASYWTEEAVLARQQAKMAEYAANALNDSSMNATGSSTTEGGNTSTSNRGKVSKSASGSRSSQRNNRTNRTTASGTMSRTTGSGTTGSGTTSGTTGTGTMSGTTGSGTTGTGTTSGTTGTGTMSGTTGSGTTGTGTMGGTSVSGTLSAMSSNTDSTLIAVNGNKFMMPTINMYIGNGTFTGYTGCNNIVGTMKVDGNQLHFENAVPVANIQCIGGFDQSAFLDRLRRADSYDVTNNQLRLKQGSQVLMVFDKNAK